MLMRINPKDNVAVCLKDMPKGAVWQADGMDITAAQDIPAFHKIALFSINQGEPVIKYGNPIGTASRDIRAGEHVHTHNVKTGLKGLNDYEYHPKAVMLQTAPMEETFMGYVREDGRVGIRNEIWIVNTVGCVNKTSEIIAAEANRRFAGQVDGVLFFAHQQGCAQLSPDHENAQKILASMVHHPNAAGVLVLGLGCEYNNITEFKKVIGDYSPERVKFIETQQEEDELEAALAAIGELVAYAKKFERQPCPVSKLTVGLKCGGSDAFSGITANPLVGIFSDMLVSRGGTTILAEVPEMFGAEHLLMERCRDREVFDQFASIINGFKQYCMQLGLPVSENPSPGNKEGGITTLEEKSLGCIEKGGTGQVCGVIAYGEMVKEHGLNILDTPGFDLVSASALAAAGAQIVIFTTGRGTPYGTAVPTVKVSTNTALYQKKGNWIDFDAGAALEKGFDALSKDFYNLIIKVANGEVHTKNEINGYRELSLLKKSVTV